MDADGCSTIYASMFISFGNVFELAACGVSFVQPVDSSPVGEPLSSFVAESIESLPISFVGRVSLKSGVIPSLLLRSGLFGVCCSPSPYSLSSASKAALSVG